MTRLSTLIALPVMAGLLAAPVAARADWHHGGGYHGAPAWHGPARPAWHGGYYNGYRGHGYRGPGWLPGAAVEAGVLGLGAVIAGTVAPPVYYAPPPAYYATPPAYYAAPPQVYVAPGY